MSKKAALFIANGSEAIEVIATADTLVRGGMELELISTMPGTDVALTQGLLTNANLIEGEFNPDMYDLIIIPGGSLGVENLLKSKIVMDAIKKFMDEGKHVASICAGPTVLNAAGVLEGRKVTCYPGCETSFPEGVYQGVIGVVVDGNLITASGPGQAIDFGLAILRELMGEQAADDVASGMLLKK